MPDSAVSAARLRVLLGPDPRVPIGYRSLADAVRLLVLDGALTPGTRMPSERDLTGALGVSRTTVARAFADLRERGFLRSRRGSGSTVRLPGPTERRPGGAPAATPEALVPAFDDDDEADVIAWTIASSAAVPGLGSLAARAVEALPRFLPHSGYHLAGVDVLREAIARRYAERGLPTAPDQVVVTAGAQAAWTLLTRTLARPGDRVLVDSPTYPNAIASLRQGGLRPVGVPLADDGWDVERIAATLTRSRPRLAYLLPDFHNPTGALMDDVTRAEVGGLLARTTGTTLVVDETMLDLGLDVGTLPAPLAAHDPGAICVGSASKSYWGGLRVGWVRAPDDVVRALLRRRPATDLGASLLDQLVVTELLADPGDVLEAHRDRLRDGRDALLDLLAEHLPDWTTRVPPGGMGLWMRLPERRSTALTVAAEGEGLLLTAGPRFFVGPGGEQNLRLPYSRPVPWFAEAVRRLARAWEATPGRDEPASAISMTA